MIKEDNLLIFHGEMLGEALGTGEISLSKLESFKSFMTNDFGLSENGKTRIFEEPLKVLLKANLAKSVFLSATEKVASVFGVDVNFSNVFDIYEFLKGINSKSYEEIQEDVATIRNLSTTCEFLEIRRIRFLLSYAISTGENGNIVFLTEKLKSLSQLLEGFQEVRSWELSDV